MMAFSLMKIYIIKESFQEKLGELLVSLSYYPANNTLTLGVLKVTISKDIYKGDINKHQYVICSIFDNTPWSADAVAAFFI